MNDVSVDFLKAADELVVTSFNSAEDAAASAAPKSKKMQARASGGSEALPKRQRKGQPVVGHSVP